MIEVGKRYRVARVDESHLEYLPDLDAYVGKEMTVSYVDKHLVFFIEDEKGWSFPKDWLEEVIEQEPQSNVDAPEDFNELFVQPGYIKRRELTGDEIADIVTDKKIRVFESGSQRDDDTNKPIPMELNPYALIRYGYHMKKGAIVHSRGNWSKTQPNDALWDSLNRHILQAYFNYRFPELATGTDDGSDHLAAAIFNIQMLLHNECIAGVPADKFFNKSNS